MDIELIWGEREAEYFCKEGWTGKSSDGPSGKSVDLYDQVVTRLRGFP
jgi:hypothetical protein